MPYLLGKSRFGINFFTKGNTILLLYMYQVFIFLQDHLHFFFTFMEQLFLVWPYISCPHNTFALGAHGVQSSHSPYLFSPPFLNDKIFQSFLPPWDFVLILACCIKFLPMIFVSEAHWHCYLFKGIMMEVVSYRTKTWRQLQMSLR